MFAVRGDRRQFSVLCPLIEKSMVHPISNIFCLDTLTENCILMSNFDVVSRTIVFQCIPPPFLLTRAFNTSPSCISSQHLYEWPCVRNSLTAFIWRVLIGWNKILYCKIWFEYKTHNIPTNNFISFEYSKHARLFVSCKLSIVSEHLL